MLERSNTPQYVLIISNILSSFLYFLIENIVAEEKLMRIIWTIDFIFLA